MEKKPTRKQIQKYEDRAVIIDGEMLPPTHEKVKRAKKELREVEQAIVNANVDTFSVEIDQRRADIEQRILDYMENEMTPVYNDDGDIVERKLNLASNDMSEYVINRLFFNSLSPLSSKEPKYNAEKLGVVFEFYEYVVALINEKICKLIPSKSHFCRFAGITTSTYNGYKLSEDPDMQVVIGKIEDMLLDTHLTMAQEYKLSAGATKYRMNVEMDKRENFNPQVVLKADVKDLDEYKSRIASLIEGEIEDE